MVAVDQSFTVYRGEELDIPITLVDVVLTGTETIEAFFRFIDGNRLELTVTATITENGSAAVGEVEAVPAEVLLSLSSDDTESLTAIYVPRHGVAKVTHRFSLERTDDPAEKPYSIGDVTVVNTARTGL